MKLAEHADRIESVDIATADLSALASALADVNRLKGATSVVEAQIVRRLAALEATGHAPPAADVLARSANSSARSAAQAGRRADTYGNAPELERQRAKGNVSDEHADALANAASRLDDAQRHELFARSDELAEHAAASTPEQFGRFLRRRTDALTSDDEAVSLSEVQRGKATLAHGIDAETGMGWFRGQLHPDDYQKFERKLAAEVGALRKRPEHSNQRYDQIAAAAFMALSTSTRAAASPVSEVAILIDLETILNGTHANSTCEYSDGSSLPVATARRHACDAEIIPVVLDGVGQPLDVGRTKRQATRSQRTALRAMYRTCAVDACETGFDRCEMHHLAEWDKHGGHTDLANLLPICSFHHHRAHEGRWRLQLEPSTRQLSVFLPNGTLHSIGLPDIIAERINAA